MRRFTNWMMEKNPKRIYLFSRFYIPDVSWQVFMFQIKSELILILNVPCQNNMIDVEHDIHRIE